MKNKILQAYGLMMLPILAVSKAIKEEAESVEETQVNEIEIVEETPEDRKARFDRDWADYFNWKVIPVEIIEERVIGK